ncbi:hypothetical protein Bbelb_154320 [Branchiostoma belcheri]|nr:hypothetical protein Bbelb_154320 [Branchiostoma belcheri]
MAAEHGAGETSPKTSSLEDEKRHANSEVPRWRLNMEREKLLLKLRPWKTRNVWEADTVYLTMWDLSMLLCVLCDLSAILCTSLYSRRTCVSEGPVINHKTREHRT